MHGETGEERPADGASAAAPIEVGWLVLGRLDPVDREAVAVARRRVLATLRERFGGFDWRMPLVERRDLALAVREEPVALLDPGIAERDAKRWDFALVVTGADLRTHDKPYALGAPSRAVGVAVLSTSRIDPQASGEELAEADRGARLAQRIAALALHLFGHLNGLEHARAETDVMYDLDEVHDLDAMTGYSEADRATLAAELAEVADLRLEERHGAPRRPAAFYLRAAWRQADDVLAAVRAAQPWLFPVRLSRLTVAAGSTLVVLLITAEAWDLGTRQRPATLAAMALVTLVATTGYVIHRQRLLVRRGGARLTEQAAVTNVAITLSVLLGLAVTYLALFVFTVALTAAFFAPSLVAGWAASVAGPIGPARYLRFAGFVAALGLAVGSLGASFEEQRYFRHIAYVDEET